MDNNEVSIEDQRMHVARSKWMLASMENWSNDNNTKRWWKALFAHQTRSLALAEKYAADIEAENAAWVKERDAIMADSPFVKSAKEVQL